MTEPLPGYHLTAIQRGVLGDESKITEEYEEFMDALDQDVHVMALVELADLLGAIAAWLEKNHPSVTLEDLLAMNEVTARAFANGHR